jgi:hypothetical protein
MARALLSLAAGTAPFALGFAIGFAVALTALKRWFADSSHTPTGDLITGLRRVGVQALLGGVALTLCCAGLLSHYLTGSIHAPLLQNSLWGLPVGLFYGLRWRFRRGER